MFQDQHEVFMSKMFYGSAPVLYIKDLAKSLDYYCDILGFERPQLWGDPPGFAMPNRENMVLMLSVQKNTKLIKPKGDIWDVYYWVRDAETLFNEFKNKGAEIKEELNYQELYQNNEFQIRDPDGYILAFGQEMDEKPLIPKLDNILYMCPVLPSGDVSRDVKWYQETLGFKSVYDSSNYQKGPIDYAVIVRDQHVIHLQFQYPKDLIKFDLKFEMDNIEFIITDLIGKSILTADKINKKTPWNTTEFSIFDPSGNRLTFLQDL